ncbi:MAG: ATP-binding cassette domain-containing protein [Phycisphaerales bacterium JB063]
MSANGLVIDLKGVEKRYGRKVHALQGVDIQVHPGEVFGLLGPNGAGKSTLVKCMLTVVRPTAATGTVLGDPLGHKPALQRVGYLPEHARFPRHLTGRQVVEFFGAMAKMPKAQCKTKAQELIDLVGAHDYADRKVGGYSKGMQQRIGIAQALVNDPDLVVLDEPTDGVDPVGRRDIREVLMAIKQRGKTVFVNSHLLSELELICDRVAIMVGGKVVQQGTIDDLTIDQKHYLVVLDWTRETADPEGLASAIGVGMKHDGDRGGVPVFAGDLEGVRYELHGPRLKVMVTEPPAIQPVIDKLRGAGIVLKSVEPKRPSLEDLFMQAAGEGGAH